MVRVGAGARARARVGVRFGVRVGARRRVSFGRGALHLGAICADPRSGAVRLSESARGVGAAETVRCQVCGGIRARARVRVRAGVGVGVKVS